jgi:hypothetical protein
LDDADFSFYPEGSAAAARAKSTVNMPQQETLGLAIHYASGPFHWVPPPAAEKDR